MKIAVIGAGASGLVFATFASKKHDVTIYSEDTIIGKKILATGNGRCNLTNMSGFDTAYNFDVSSFFQCVNHLDIISFFNGLGLEVFVDEENRVYPISNSAQSVVDVLCMALEKNNVKYVFEKVLDIQSKTKNVITENTKNCFDKIVIATGSNSFLLDKLDVKYKSFSPSLVALKTTQNTLPISGLRLSNVKVTLNFKNKIHEEFGEVLFKDKGLSGICIFNLSAYLARQNDYKAKVFIDLLPIFNFDNLKIMLNNRLKLNLKDANEFMTGLFHKKINKYILNYCKINLQKNTKDFSSKDIEDIANAIKNLQFDICGHYDNNQVNSGGVSLDAVDRGFMHKQLHDIYFIGEVLDVDGICGGYNLTWAFASAIMAGEACLK